MKTWDKTLQYCSFVRYTDDPDILIKVLEMFLHVYDNFNSFQEPLSYDNLQLNSFLL